MPEIKPALPLLNWTCISLRPEGQHHALRYANKAFGASVIECSPIRLQALAADDEIRSACACDIVIATSPAAVKFAAQSSAFSIQKNTQWYGVGPSTANALKKLGVTRVDYPRDQQSSEGLLRLPSLQVLKSKSVGLLTAPGGRNLIAPMLETRGAQLCLAQVYSRMALSISHDKLNALTQASMPVAVFCTSYEVFLALWQGLNDDARECLKRYRWVLSSERLAALLAAQGLVSALICHTAVPQIMLKMLANDVQA
jgi:uroporphyrinogen-III synthase